MPNNSQSKMTTDLMTMRAQYNLLSDDTEKLLMYASEVSNRSECYCASEQPENQPCGACMLKKQVAKMVRAGSPLESVVVKGQRIMGDLNRG